IPKALNISKLRADIAYQHRCELDDLFSTFLNATLTHDNTILAQTIHSSTISTQMNDNTTLTQTTHSNNTDLDEIQNVHLDNKDEDNEECDLPYISEAEFSEYLQEWEVDIIEDQYDSVELDDVIHLAIDKNAKWNLS
ncbi:44182_t:CDS:2, partial [Gigaspora margarita]